MYMTLVIYTSRSARPTDVLWVVAKGVLCHDLPDGPKGLRNISEFSLEFRSLPT